MTESLTISLDDLRAVFELLLEHVAEDNDGELELDRDVLRAIGHDMLA